MATHSDSRSSTRAGFRNAQLAERDGLVEPSGSEAVSAIELASDLNGGRPQLPEAPWLDAKLPGRRRGRALAMADFLGAVVAVPVALLLLAVLSNVPNNSLSHFWPNLAVDWIFPVCVLAALAISGFYRSAQRSVHASTFIELKDLAFSTGMGCALGLAVGLLAHRLFGTPEPATAQMVIAVLVAIPVIACGRAAVRALRHTISSSRIVILGSGQLVGQIETYLKLQPGNEVIGHVVDPEATDPEALKEPGCIGTLRDLPSICATRHVERIVIGFPATTSPAAVATLRSLQNRVKMAVVPRYFELVSWRSRLTDLYGLPLLELAAPHISKWDRFIKRTLDITVASVALLLLLPAVLLIALLIKLTSPGGVLFRQVRVGQNRQLFTIYKFRTMSAEPSSTKQGSAFHANQDSSRPLYEVHNKAADESRVITVGKILRKTSLDEIPQLWNVLVGDMSLVGPRPFVPAESEDLATWASIRFQVRPGITGLWQVSGRNNLCVDDLRRLDYLYVASWSMWWDMKILWDTPRTVVRGFGAY